MVKYLRLVLVLVFVVVGILIYVNYFYGGGDVGSGGESGVASVGVDGEIEEKEIPKVFEGDEPAPDFGSSGSSGSAGAGSGAGSSGGTSGECQNFIVSYSLNDFSSVETCNLAAEGVCIDKSVKCSLAARNLDYEFAGNFGIEFAFYDVSAGAGGSGALKSVLGNIFLNPREEGVLEKTFRFEGFDASREIKCSYSAVSIPEKEVC